MTEPKEPFEVDGGDRPRRAMRALAEELTLSPRLDPTAAGRVAGNRLGRQRVVAAVAAAVVVLVGSATLALTVGPDAGRVAAPAGGSSQDPAPPRSGPDPLPEGWRLEQFRDVVFAVPADWGHGYEPGGSWCAAADTNAPAQPRPYVDLGGPQVEAAIACPELPDRLVDEHVAVRDAIDSEGDTVTEQAGFAIVTRVVSGVELTVTSKDPDLVAGVLDSIRPVVVDDRCQPTTAATVPGAEPAPGFDAAPEDVSRVVLCQYDPGYGDVPAEDPLRAATELQPAAGRELVAQIMTAPTPEPPPCAFDAEDPDPLELVVVLRVETEGVWSQIWLRGASCPDGSALRVGSYATGSGLRAVSRETCQATLQPPLRLEAAGEALYDVCAE